MMRYRWWLGITIIAFDLTLTGTARASCAVSSSSAPATPASLGSVSSFVIKNQPQVTSTSNSGLTCSGSLLSLFSTTDHIYATIASANSSTLTNTNGDKIPYQIFADPSYSIQLTPGTRYDYASGQVLNLLGLFGGPSKSLPMYFSTLTGSVVQAGQYQDMLTINWAWDYCSGIGTLGLCLGRDRGSGQSSFLITVDVTNDCMITAPTINFGAAPTVATFALSTGSISMTCTKGLTYTVGLSPGNNPAPNGRRQMANGTGRLQYDLYNGATLWQHSGNRVGSMPSDGVTAQQFTVNAQIYQDQDTPAVGMYNDSVIIDIQY